MFVPLQITKAEIIKLKGLFRSITVSDQDAEKDLFFTKVLNKVTYRGVLDGCKLSSLVFPFDKYHYDIFISYSHDDKDEASFLCSYLRKKGLHCFLDSTIWNSADDLLWKIDNLYCTNTGDDSFDYLKRNFSTSHVHAMLSMAMLEAIRRSECCIFIRSEKSLTLEEGIDNHTLSPWIYEEASFINNIQISVPARYRIPTMKMFCEGGNIEMRDITTNKLKVKYVVDLSHFVEICHNDIICNEIGTEILDKIYHEKNIIQSMRQLI